jgi:hypothetical protein
MPPALLLLGCLVGAALTFHAAPLLGAEQPIRIATAPQASAPPAKEDEEKQSTPEQKMQKRFPQPVRVGFLVGLPVLDWQDSTIGYVHDVVRTADGKIKLIVPYGRWLGWIRYGGIFDWIRRPVAVPLETVAILARQIDALDMSREEFDAAPTWIESQGRPVPRDEKIQIAIARR